ncbi:MAG: TetR/AcrR family transcriptional regulator [Algiphilus sp.]
MARPLAFDRDRALRSATRLFWTRGYHATAMPALLDHMGIARSSLYASFGDKRHLFMECLELFGQQTARLANAPPGVPATNIVWGFFHATLQHVSEERLRNGCLLVNSTLELADSEPALCAQASAQLEGIERRFAQAFQAAEAQDRFKAPLDAVVLARYVMTVNQGLRVRSRQGMPREALWKVLTTSLGLIGLAPPQPHGDAPHAH